MSDLTGSRVSNGGDEMPVEAVRYDVSPQAMSSDPNCSSVDRRSLWVDEGNLLAFSLSGD